jgi:hypothetical protein
MRNLYAKIGTFFGSGEQVRGFGFLHDGSVDTVETFLEAPVFSLNNAQELDLEQYSLAFPTDLAPIVGQQVTLDSTNSGVVDPRIDLMIARASTTYNSLLLGGAQPECDVIVKGSVGGVERGWERESGGLFRDDNNNTISDAALRALANSEGPLTYTCAPPGSGTRMGINRDEDNHLDGLDNCPSVPNNGQEDTNMNGIGDACEAGGPPPLDSDGDGIKDIHETDTGTFNSPTDTGSDPFNADSDGDNFDDGFEVLHGSDPNDANSIPSPIAAPALGPAGGWLAFAGLLAMGMGLLLRRRTQGVLEG